VVKAALTPRPGQIHSALLYPASTRQVASAASLYYTSSVRKAWTDGSDALCTSRQEIKSAVKEIHFLGADLPPKKYGNRHENMAKKKFKNLKILWATKF
jgi:hypothetical protein